MARKLIIKVEVDNFAESKQLADALKQHSSPVPNYELDIAAIEPASFKIDQEIPHSNISELSGVILHMYFADGSPEIAESFEQSFSEISSPDLELIRQFVLYEYREILDEAYQTLASYAIRSKKNTLTLDKLENLSFSPREAEHAQESNQLEQDRPTPSLLDFRHSAPHLNKANSPTFFNPPNYGRKANIQLGSGLLLGLLSITLPFLVPTALAAPLAFALALTAVVLIFAAWLNYDKDVEYKYGGVACD